MNVCYSRVAYTLKQKAQAAERQLPLNHAQQLTAAALGYKTLASLQAASDIGDYLDAMRHLVLSRDPILKRAGELGLDVQEGDGLMQWIHDAFKEHLPRLTVHSTLAALENHLQRYVDQRLLDKASGELASTNGDGIDEIYLPFDFSLEDLPDPDEEHALEISGHITVELDTERPYSGHKVEVEASLLLTRVCRQGIADPAINVERIKLASWGDEDDGSIPSDDLQHALAKLLEIDADDAAPLVDVAITANQSDDGMLYSYILDFSEVASPQMAEHIVKQFGALIVHVDPAFIDTLKTEPLEY